MPVRSTATPAEPAGRRGAGFPRRRWHRGVAYAFAAAALLHVCALLTQAVLAGQFLGGNYHGLPWHETVGTVVIGQITILQLSVAIILWWPARGPAWPTLSTLALFAVEYVQIDLGFSDQLEVHVPLGVGIVVGSLAILAGAVRLTRTARWPGGASNPPPGP